MHPYLYACVKQACSHSEVGIHFSASAHVYAWCVLDSASIFASKVPGLFRLQPLMAMFAVRKALKSETETALVVVSGLLAGVLLSALPSRQPGILPYVICSKEALMALQHHVGGLRFLSCALPPRMGIQWQTSYASFLHEIEAVEKAFGMSSPWCCSKRCL